jgi:hypothetical protein
MFIFHIHQPPYLYSSAIWCTSYKQVKVPKITLKARLTISQPITHSHGFQIIHVNMRWNHHSSAQNTRQREIPFLQKPKPMNSLQLRTTIVGPLRLPPLSSTITFQARDGDERYEYETLQVPDLIMKLIIYKPIVVSK